MSDTADDELLAGEDEDMEGYDISQEREDVLLRDQDDEEYGKGRDRGYYERKKESDPESEDLDDVLDINLDFQDEDKLLYDDDPPEKKDKDITITVKNTETQVTKPVVQVPAKTTPMDKRPGPGPKKPDTAIQKGNNFKKNEVRNARRGKRGTGRGNFQTRPNFTNNNMSRRRNGTVLINPRYEGTVHVHESNARLKWDNQYPQSSYVQPWNGGNATTGAYDVNLQNQLLNVVSGIANSLVQTPANMLVPPPPIQNFYEPPRANNYEQPLAFEPPPHIAEEQHSQLTYQQSLGWENSYGLPNQVTNHQMLPQGQSTYPRESTQYNNQMSTDRRGIPQTYNTYNDYNNYGPPKRQNNVNNMGQKKVLGRTNSYENKNSYNGRYENTYSSTYSAQDNFQNANINYGNENYQNKNGNTNQGNYTNNKYSYQGNQNVNYKQELPNKNQTTNYNNSQKIVPNNSAQQNQNNFNKSNTFVGAQVQNRNLLNKPATRRLFDMDDRETKDAFEKRAKFNQDGKNSVKEEKKEMDHKPIELTVKSEEREEDEDEETKQYRLKIEEQKREREKILAIKEARRMQMLLERKRHEAEKLPEVKVERPIAQVKNQVKKANPPPARKFDQPALFTRKHKFDQSAGTVNAQTPNQHVAVQNLKFVQPVVGQFESMSDPFLPRQFPREPLQGSSSSVDELPNLTFKISNNLQSGVPLAKEAPKTEASSSSFMSNRVVVVKNKGQARVAVGNSDVVMSIPPAPAANQPANAPSDVGVSSFFNSRKVLKKDNNLTNTRLVVVNNLSATITQSKLMELSRGIGEIQNLRVDAQERQATILFKSVASAQAFFKKYQRRILDDLSVIEVKLEPM